jgi:hypothetical protein
MTNILYFEGAGMEYDLNELSNVGNYRIRTAFKNLDGIEYYIELGNAARHGYLGNSQKLVTVSEWALHIDHLFKIEDRNKIELSTGGYEIPKDRKELKKYDYTKENITKWINQNLNCNFDSIEVLNEFYGYQVHGGYKNGEYTYNLIDNADIDHERANKRKEAFSILDKEYRKNLNSKYRVINIEEMDNDSMTIKCFASEEKLSFKNLERYKRIKVS